MGVDPGQASLPDKAVLMKRSVLLAGTNKGKEKLGSLVISSHLTGTNLAKTEKYRNSICLLRLSFSSKGRPPHRRQIRTLRENGL
jgi:hypothetical protein